MSRKPQLSVVVAGGGTGGHIEPALNLADELRDRWPDSSVVALGTVKGLESRLVPARGYELELVPPVPLPRRVSRELFSVPGRLAASVMSARAVIEERRADVVVGFGGYVALPAYLAAKRVKVPFVVHEANARPGLANRVGARFTPWVAENYAGSLPHARRLGCPLRSAVANLDRSATRAEARAFFGLDADGPVLLVFGGSQGARSINAALAPVLPAFRQAGVQVLHAVGPAQDEPPAPGPGYRPVPYIERMDLAYAAADLAVCRSGAMTCAEVAAVGLPALYVPYPIGNGEQRLNAEPVVAAGGGLVVDDAALSPAVLRDRCLPLLADSARLATMSERAAAYGIRDGAAQLADLVVAAAEAAP